MREEAATEPVVVDADTAAAQEFVGGLIEQAFSMDEAIVDRWMGVGVSVRLSDPAESDPETLGVTVQGHNGPTAPQDLRDVLQLAIDSLDASHGTSYAGGQYGEDEAS